MMFLVMYLASADKRSSAVRFQAILCTVNSSSEACRATSSPAIVEHTFEKGDDAAEIENR
jgi:hypothetical protein